MTKETYNILKRMEERPAMWLGECTLKALSSFLMGYQSGLTDKGIDEHILPTFEFFEWIKNKLGYYESTAGWANMILASTMGLDPKNIDWDSYDINVSSIQHNTSFKKFYELLEDYMNEKTECNRNKK
ncbi:hypothetical protein [Tenacibaculum sp. nBUS_03]|uniref:hypothetical protein n=1 Tax=Tenacibaculum sp. nBUS_03 TaxID=3395320 RepID=UPI003EB695E7